MPQFLISPADISGSTFTLRGPEARHFLRVLRGEIGERISLFDGKGYSYEAIVTRIDLASTTLSGDILSTAQSQPPSTPIRLFQGLPKGDKFDYVIEKATELGVDRLTPFFSDKSPVQLSPDQAERKTQRWQRLAAAASKQCGRKWLPRVDTPVALESLAGDITPGFVLVCEEGQGWPSLKNALKKIKETSTVPPSAMMNLIVGPESGLAPSERTFLQTCGAQRVSLGSLTLRTETAGLVALSIINYEWERTSEKTLVDARNGEQK